MLLDAELFRERVLGRPVDVGCSDHGDWRGGEDLMSVAVPCHQASSRPSICQKAIHAMDGLLDRSADVVDGSGISSKGSEDDVDMTEVPGVLVHVEYLPPGIRRRGEGLTQGSLGI